MNDNAMITGLRQWADGIDASIKDGVDLGQSDCPNHSAFLRDVANRLEELQWQPTGPMGPQVDEDYEQAIADR